jgi:hypothetical protein
VDIVYTADYALVQQPADAASFTGALKNWIFSLEGMPSPIYLQIVLNQGSIIATVQSNSEDAIAIIIAALNQGNSTFTWRGTPFMGTTTTNCKPGFNPNAQGACTPCPRNTYVSHFLVSVFIVRCSFSYSRLPYRLIDL